MSTLLLRFAGPMQAWGSPDSQFDTRKTNREPTKSAVIGLLAAAQGMRRDEPLDRLAALRYGVRVDREGVVLHDFHMAQGKKSSYLTHRYYLCDAVFLVGVFSEDEAWMHQLEEAVRYPAFPLFLGRRSCPPEGRVCLGLRDVPLEEALKREPALVCGNTGVPAEKRRMVLDDPTGSARLRDVPVSFSPRQRMYAYRAAQETWTKLPENEHDPMRELR